MMAEIRGEQRREDRQPESAQSKGFVIACDPNPHDETKPFWRLRITSGPGAGRRATVHRDHVPKWIAVRVNVRFEIVPVDDGARFEAVNIEKDL